MLCTNRKSDGIRPDPLIQQLLLRKLGMGRGRGMDDEALHVRHVGQQREDLQMIDERPGFFLSPIMEFSASSDSSHTAPPSYVQEKRFDDLNPVKGVFFRRHVFPEAQVHQRVPADLQSF